MTREIITPEIVEQLYLKLDNKQIFLVLFGTKKFYLVGEDFLHTMYEYLVKKVK